MFFYFNGAAANGKSFNFFPFGILKHFEQYGFLPFSVSRTQEVTQYVEVRLVFKQISGGISILCGCGRKTKSSGIFIKPCKKKCGVYRREFNLMRLNMPEHQGYCRPDFFLAFPVRFNIPSRMMIPKNNFKSSMVFKLPHKAGTSPCVCVHHDKAGYLFRIYLING